MGQMYQLLASIAQSVGVLYFMAIFMGVVVYALWPANAGKFTAASRLPLEDE